MTTVSVVECVSPVSLRTCGSSTSSLLQNRKRLQTKCISASKRSSQNIHSSQEIRDGGLEATLMSSPIPSPIPRATISLCGDRSSRNTTTKSPSPSSVELNEGDTEKEIARTPSVISPDLCVVGSKPRLYGMWEIAESRPVTALSCQPPCVPSEEDLFDTIEADDERMSSASPDNPPPSPINFLSDIDGFVIGGQKLICPERFEQSHPSHNRDFNPGFVKQPQHHCVKCQGRIIEEELSQVTLHRRLSSIISSHTSKHNHVSDYIMNECKENHSTPQLRAPGQSDTHDCYQLHEKLSMSEMHAEKKRLKREKERLMKKQREIRKEEKRIDELTKLKEKIQRKEVRSQQILNKTAVNRHGKVKTKTVEVFEDTVKRKTVEVFEDLQNGDQENTNTDLNTHNSKIDLHLPSIYMKISTPSSASSSRKNALKSAQRRLVALKISSELDGKEETFADVRRSRSDTVGKIENIMQDGVEERVMTDTENVKRKMFCAKKILELDVSSEVKLSSLNYDVKAAMIGFDSSTTLTSDRNFCMSVSTDDYSELRMVQENAADGSSIDRTSTEPSVTTTSTMIVPERDTPCSQWVSFNGDNEPVLNTSPEVDEGCDTFLKRLQRTKLTNQNDPALPSGQQFCFEAMIDKRYNRWKRRRRKKQSEARRTSVLQVSESSDEDDVRNTAMERIIDKMYEEMNGPVPQTPNGSRDTPRSRNRHRRKESKNAPKAREDHDAEEQTSSISLYEASSEWTSDGALPSSSSAEQIVNPQIETATFEPEPETPQPSRSGTFLDDLCSWPYLEQYRTEILKRLKSSNADQLEDFDHNDWLPEIKTPENSTTGEGLQEKCDLANRETGKFYLGSPDISEPKDTVENFNPENTIIQIDKVVDIENERVDVEEETKNTDEQQQDSDNTTDEYQPYIRVEETPRQSPVKEATVDPEYYITNVSAKPRQKKDPTRQTYSYTKWSRSQRPSRKPCSTEQKPKLLSRTDVTSWSEMGYDQGFQENTDAVSTGDTNTDLSEIRPIVHNENVQSTKDRLAKKSQKVALNIKKHNVNLPSLTKNSRSQTLPDTGGKIGLEKPDRPAKVKQKPTKSFEERPKMQTPRNLTPTRASVRETHSLPEFLFKDFYLRSLYGNKTRINSHADSNKTDKTLRKTLTVDNLELISKKPKKRTDISKPNELSFTRSFTFSMFDLPEMYKLYNTTLERRANEEEIVTQE